MNLDAQVEFQQVGALLDGTLVGTVDGELVRQDVAVSMLCPPRINAIAGNLNG